jgi:UDP-N-acetylglucosamine 2-epimerase (non-hydrolysing)
MLIDIEKVLIDDPPSVVLVEEDTNTVLAGVIAAARFGTKVGHAKAGL